MFNTTPKQVLLVLLVLSIAFWIFYRPDPGIPRITGSGIVKPAEAPDYYLQSRTEDALRARMKDPGATQFRNVRVVNRGGRIVCGEVNGKNGFGGYTGFERFYGLGDLVVLSADMAAGEFETMWAQRC